MRLVPTDLNTTLDQTLLKAGVLADAVNVSLSQNVLEARAGMAQFWKRGSFNSSDICYGFGFGRYGGVEEFLVLVKKNGDTNCTVYVVDESGSTIRNYSSDAWTKRSASDWRFAQFGKFIYAANESDGLWRWEIGASSDTGWAQVPTVLQSVVEPTGNFLVGKPPYSLRQWASATDTGVAPTSPTSFQVSTAPTVDEGNLVLEQTGNKGTTVLFYNWFTVSFSSALDLIDNRYLYCVCQISCDWDDTRTHEEPFYDISRQAFVYVTDSTDAPGSESSAWSANWKQARIYPSLLELSPAYNSRYATVGFHIDLESIHDSSTSTILDTVKQISIGVPMGSGNDYRVQLGPLFLGGVWMSKPYYEDQMSGDPLQEPPKNANLPVSDLSYVVTYYDTGTTSESSGEYTSIPRTFTFGQPYVSGNIPLGTEVNISLPAPSVGYDRTRLYRKRYSSAGGEWVLLTSTATATTFTDSYVDSATDPNAWPATLVRDANYNFGGVIGDLTPSAIAAWKGHLVLGVGEEVYMSYQGDATRFVMPVRKTLSGSIITDDPTIGRTLYMSNTIGDTVLSLIAQDVLYGVGYEGVYAMVGDSASDATPFRKMPGSYGAIGKSACCGYADGVLVGNKNGLYYSRLSRLGTALEATNSEIVEMTQPVRRSWALMNAKGYLNDLVVSVVDEEIICARGRFVMRRTKDGQWEYHEYNSNALTSGETTGSVWGTAVSLPGLPTGYNLASGAVVTRNYCKSTYTNFDFTPTVAGSVGSGFIGFHYDSKLGIFGMSRSGVLMQLDKAANGAKYKTDANYAIPWCAVFGDIPSTKGARFGDVSAYVENVSGGSSDGPVRFIVEEFSGKQGVMMVAQDRLQTQTDFNLKSFGSPGGFLAQIIVCSGNAAQRVVYLDVDPANTGNRRSS